MRRFDGWGGVCTYSEADFSGWGGHGVTAGRSFGVCLVRTGLVIFLAIRESEHF